MADNWGNAGAAPSIFGNLWKGWEGFLNDRNANQRSLGPIQHNDPDPAALGMRINEGVMAGLQGRSPTPVAPTRHSGESSSNVLDSLRGMHNTSQDLGQQGIPSGISRPAEVDPLDAKIAEIQRLMQEVNMGGDPAAYQADVDSAFAGSFGAINKARERAKSGYNESDNVLRDLTAGHVNQIQTGDRQAIGKANDDLVGNYDKSYNEANKALGADRQKEISAKTEMLSRLGLEEAGIGSAGSEQTNAISRMTQQNAGAKAQAAGYRQADEVRNTELASSQADAGLERRAGLRRDLDKINGNLDNSAATVENAKSQAMLAGKNASKADGMKMMEFYQNQIKDISDTKEKREQTSYDRGIDARDFASKNSGSGGGVYEAVKQSIQNSSGENAQPYMDAYSDVVSQNGYDSRSGADKIAYYQQQMLKKNPKLRPQTALSFITGVENYGTDKLK